MKKVFLIIISLIGVLSGCLNPTSVRVVEDMYTKALLEDSDAVATYFSEEMLLERSAEELTEELAAHPRHVGGIPLLNATELTRNRLNPEIVEELDATYDEKWHFIVNDAAEGEVMTWIVIKTPSQYEIVAGEQITNTHYQQHILK